jgi:diguanylate cyclase (GGDEF)-like protein
MLADVAFLESRYDAGAVAVSVLIAMFVSYVALDLAKRVRTPDRTLALGWWAGGSLAMGSGIWSMHFVGMFAFRLPIAIGYDYGVTFLSWLAAVAVSGIALAIASQRRLTVLHLAGGAVAMGAGICAMHYTGMLAIDMAPGIVWNGALVALSALIATGASAVALMIFFWLRKSSGWRGQAWQAAAGAVMGIAISGMHYTGMAAANFVDGAVCLSAGALRGDSLGTIAAMVSIGMLTLTMCTSILDARMHGNTARLAASLKLANEQLQQLAFRDPLTGLPNRSLFEQELERAVERCELSGGALTLLFIDLDGFKPVNDSFGHPVGDVVLREVGERLRSLAADGDTVARAGGDEFLLASLALASADDAARLAERVIDALGRPYRMAARDVSLSCSIGIVRFPEHGSRDKLIAHADAAMYAAKRVGGSTYAFFESRMETDIREQVELQRDLRLAIERSELELYYQPKIDGRSGQITGAEALVRWHHPSRGLLGPGLFIPVAERFGLIGALGNWVIDDACRQVRVWLDGGLRMRVAVNLSVHQLRQDDLVARIRGALVRHGVDPKLLTFEITESVAMEDTQATMRAFAQLARLGVSLSIDDFGTGYSSLAYLRKLPARQLKIDRSFVADIDQSADALAVVDAVVRLAHALGLKVVAEGVETETQRDILLGLHCDELQGFLFAKPMSARALTLWATEEDGTHEIDFRPSLFLGSEMPVQ